MGEFRMPSLGADMDEGTVVEWLVTPGTEVHRGDIVAVVATDKADIEVEIFESGVIEQLLVGEGEKVAVGTPLAVVRSTSAPAPAPQPAPEPAPAPAPAPQPAPAPPTPAPVPPGGRATPSPVLRRLARHLGVDLSTLAGTGPGGAITRADIEAAASAAPPAPGGPAGPLPAEAPAAAPPPTGDRSAAMRDALAALMARSKREIPHYYLSLDVDFSRARAWLDEANATLPITERLVPAALVIKAVAVAAREHPVMNGLFVDGTFTPAGEVNVGVAVSLRDGGLIAPALSRVDEKPLVQVGVELRDLVTRTRSGRLRASEMSGPTITVTNLGEHGVDRVLGVIYPPQVALVGVGRIVERPWARDGMVGAHPVVTISLSADHRVSDGHRGGRFLARIDQLLQEPEQL